MIQRLLIITLLAVALAGVSLAQDASTHTVRAGETLYRIATTNGMTVDELKRLNGLTDNVIKVGQVLRLANRDVAPPPAVDVDETEPGDAAAGVEAGATSADTEPGDAFDDIDPGDAADDADPGDAADDIDLGDAAGDAEPGDVAGDADPGDAADDAEPGDAADDIDPGDAAEEPRERANEVGPGRGADETQSAAGSDESDLAVPREPLDDTAALTARGVTTHMAQQGETLYSIAADRGTKAYILFTLNEGIREPIEPGTPVIVPASTGPATYEVRRGDTLSKIAAARGTTVAALRRANALQSDALEVGRLLTIPGAAAGDDPMQGGAQTYAIGSVTVFPETYAGRVMAGGSAYDPAGFVVAHRELPFDTVLIVENAATGRASFARVADRGPVDDRRLMEISSALAEEIGVAPGGQVRVRLVE